MTDIRMEPSRKRSETAKAAGTTATGALALALGASFAPAPADAAVIIVDHPDVLLGAFNLDVDNDTNPEFFFHHEADVDFDGNFVDTFLNAVVGFTDDPFDAPKNFAERLGPGALIDASSNFVSGEDVVLTSSKDVAPFCCGAGEFFAPGLAYVGLRFDLGDGLQYGWAEVDVGSITMLRFGYEEEVGVGLRTPGTGIPEPATLGLLALGATGIMALRRRQRER